MIAGRYDLEREIGRGGMGAVWLGRDTVLGREVALKRIGLMPGAGSPTSSAPSARRGWPRGSTIRTSSRSSTWSTDGDETWLVMEYVEGITLSALVKRDGALTPDEAAPLVRQAADALGCRPRGRDRPPRREAVEHAGHARPAR